MALKAYLSTVGADRGAVLGAVATSAAAATSTTAFTVTRLDIAPLGCYR
jgi:mannitol-specific phosphotransferase system IIBC component